MFRTAATPNLKRQLSSSALELRQVVREIQLLQSLEHPSIVKLKTHFVSASVLPARLVLRVAAVW